MLRTLAEIFPSPTSIIHDRSNQTTKSGETYSILEECQLTRLPAFPQAGRQDNRTKRNWSEFATRIPRGETNNE